MGKADKHAHSLTEDSTTSLSVLHVLRDRLLKPRNSFSILFVSSIALAGTYAAAQAFQANYTHDSSISTESSLEAPVPATTNNQTTADPKNSNSADQAPSAGASIQSSQTSITAEIHNGDTPQVTVNGEPVKPKASGSSHQQVVSEDGRSVVDVYIHNDDASISTNSQSYTNVQIHTNSTSSSSTAGGSSRHTPRR